MRVSQPRDEQAQIEQVALDRVKPVAASRSWPRRRCENRAPAASASLLTAASGGRNRRYETQMRIVGRSEMVHPPRQQLELQPARSQCEEVGDEVGIQFRGRGA